MKNYIFLCLAAIVAFAQASANADPAQTMIYWVAYRFEVEAYQEEPGSMRIATGCAGSAPKKRCNFDEFINHITGRPAGTFTTQFTDKWDLDPEAGMEELHRIGFTGRAQMSRLLPHLAPGTWRPFNEYLTAIMRYVERASQEMKSSGRNPGDYKWFQGITLAAEEVIKIRTQEQAAGFKRDIIDWMARKGKTVKVVMEKQEWKISDGKTLEWDGVDWKKTLGPHRGEVRQDLIEFHDEYTQIGGTSEDNILKKGQDHATLIESYNQLSLMVGGMC